MTTALYPLSYKKTHNSHSNISLYFLKALNIKVIGLVIRMITLYKKENLPVSVVFDESLAK